MASENINIRVRGELRNHLESQIGEGGLYENASEYIRSLIRKDYQSSQEAWKWLADHLREAAMADESEYVEVTLEEVLERNSPSR